MPPVTASSPGRKQKAVWAHTKAAKAQALAAPPHEDRALNLETQRTFNVRANGRERLAHLPTIASPPDEVVHVADEAADAAGFEEIAIGVRPRPGASSYELTIRATSASNC